MAFDDPASIDFKGLFREAHMFESRRAWEEAGFQIFNRATSGKIMVARHLSVQGLLFKKYSNEVAEKDQLRNYTRRLEGADRLRAFIDRLRLSRVTVPHKWVFELPRAVARKEPAYMLVVEHLDLLGDEQTKAAYARIDLGTLKDLCTLLFHFRGMDSNGKNLPFTSGGQIACIDTEHWDRSTRKAYLHHLGEYLPTKRYKLAKKFFGQLEDGDSPNAIEEDIRDFVDEEDTSSSSSSSSSSRSSS